MTVVTGNLPPSLTNTMSINKEVVKSTNESVFLRNLSIPTGQWHQIQQLIFPQTDCAQSDTFQEGFCMALARPYGRKGAVSYQVERVIPLAEEDYSRRNGGRATLSRKSSSRLNQIAANAAALGLVPLHIHSHPRGVERFSSVDNQSEQALSRWLSQQRQPILLSLVQAEGGVPYAQIWMDGVNFPLPLRIGLQPVRTGTVSAKERPALSRQVAFGPQLREAAESLQIAIVGVGGIGMLVAEQLARAGFRRFVLMDMDHVSESNLNRLPGLYRRHIGKPKVKVLKGRMQRICRSVGTRPEITALQADLYTANRWQESHIVQSDLVLALTDNQLSRIRALELALQGGCGFLMAGVDVRLNHQGEVVGLFAEVSGAEKGRYCPICSGRIDPGQASLEARAYVGGEVQRRAIEDGYVQGVTAPAVMSLNAMAAGTLVLEIQRRVSGLGERDFWQCDYQSGEVIAVERLDEYCATEQCMVCEGEAAVN